MYSSLSSLHTHKEKIRVILLPSEQSLSQEREGIVDLKSGLVHGVLDGAHGLVHGSLFGLEVVDGDTSFWNGRIILAGASKLLHGDFTSRNHALFCLTDPDTRIVILLIGLVGTSGVSNLTLEVIVLFLFECTETIPIRPLSIRVNVHLDDTIRDCLGNLIISGTGTTVHDKEDRLVGSRTKLLLGISLVLSETSRLEGDVTGLVDTVDVSKGGGDGEHVSNLGESIVNGIHLLGGGVKLLRVNILVVNTIFLALLIHRKAVYM